MQIDDVKMTTFVADESHREGEQMSNASRQAIALAMALAITLGGVPLSALARPDQGSGQRGPGSQAASVDAEIDESLPLDVDHLRKILGGLPVDIDQMRRDLVRRATMEVRNSHEEMLAQRASHTLDLLDILTTKSAWERHTKIRRLPVEITRSPSTRGPSGTVQTFLVRGKPTLEIFIPSTATSARSGASDEVEHPSGPSAPFAPPAMTGCYDGPEPCATPQEMEDLGILIAQAQADIDNGWSGYYASCQLSPEDCQILAENREQLSGPSDAADCGGAGPCAQEAASAVVALAGGASALAGTYLGYTSAVASGLALTTAGWAMMGASVFGIGVGVGYYIGAFGQCVYYAVALVAVDSTSGLDPFEVVPVFRNR